MKRDEITRAKTAGARLHTAQRPLCCDWPSRNPRNAPHPRVVLPPETDAGKNRLRGLVLGGVRAVRALGVNRARKERTERREPILAGPSRVPSLFLARFPCLSPWSLSVLAGWPVLSWRSGCRRLGRVRCSGVAPQSVAMGGGRKGALLVGCTM